MTKVDGYRSTGAEKWVHRLGAVRHVDPGLVVIGVAGMLALPWFVVDQSSSRWLELIGWLLTAAAATGFAVTARRIARVSPSRAVRRFWGTCVLAGACFAAAGLIQVWALARCDTGASTVLGTQGHALALSAATGVILVGLLSGPPAVASGDARTRYRLDVTMVMAAAVTIGVYVVSLPGGSHYWGQTGLAVLIGPVPILIAILVMIKLVMGGNPPFAASAAMICGAAAGFGGIPQLVPSGWATGHGVWMVGVYVLSCLLLAAGARVQLGHSHAPDAQAHDRDPRYSFVPYLAVVATFALLVVELAVHGRTGRMWVLLTGMFVCCVLVWLRQLASFRQIQELSERLRDMAYHDRLTGLANRGMFMDRLAAAAGPTVFLIDLDGFKPVNDQYGHATGDRLLIEVGQRLRRCVGPTDVTARLGGDEFAVLADDLGPRRRNDLAVALRHVLHGDVRIGNTVVPLSASIGSATADTTWDPDTLLHEADMAMYGHKRGRQSAPAV